MNPRVHRSRVTHDRWLVSYADFITLLFAFFVVLYAFAKADQKKQVEVSGAIDAAFRSLGIFPETLRRPIKNARVSIDANGGAERPMTPADIVVREDLLSHARVKDDLDHIRRELEQTLSSQLAKHTISIQLGPDGLVISLREAGFFNSGSAVPRPETADTLRQIAVSLRRTTYPVRIEGHTDNVPIHNDEFDSNWELSSARATRIARMLLALHAITPDRLSAAGYAEFQPIASNATADGRAENRRVDLVVMPRVRLDLGAPAQATSADAWNKITDK
jgi:chemotaxis protein MotB